jgi:hypothetical protein
MEQISVNDYLNIDNPWSKRLLGFTDFKKKRDVQQVENEYNLEKYARLLPFDFKTAEEYKAKEFEQAGLHPITGTIYISQGDAIYKTSMVNARKIYNELMQSKLEKYASENICELGCGYGYNLSLSNKNVYGGEYSSNAVKIAKKIGLNVQEFNYYTAEDYNFLKPNTTIFTTHSIEQIPDATVIINNLEKQKDKINYVIHFEPTVINERSSLLGLMRNKYMELNDYNRNLLYVLKERSDIEILELQTDIFGLVPLNTTNLIIWKFKK